MSKAETILVTGATGRLGRALVPRLLDLEFEVRCLALPEDPGAQALEASGVEVVLGRLESGEGLERAAKDVSQVLHMAARLPGAGTSDEALVESIVIGTFNLIEAVSTCAQAYSHFVYVSSSAVYGPQLAPLHVPIREDHPVRPTSVYGAAKAAAEAFVTAYANRGDIRGTIVRPSDIVEPSDVEPPNGFMTRRFRLDDGRVVVPLDEAGQSNTMSFLSAGETARGLVEAMRAVGDGPEAFHIGPWRSSTDLEVGEALARKLGWEVATETTGDPARQWVLDCTKAHETFGFRSKEQIDAIL